MMLPYGVVRDSPVQVLPIVVAWKVSVDFLKQQVCTVRGKVREVYIFLRGWHVPPHVDSNYR